MIQKVISGSKGGSQKPHNPVEMEDNLISINKIKILLAVSDGEIDETFSLKQLMFNSVPVQNEDGSFNFEGVKAEFRSGTQTQEYIKGMEDSSSEVTVNREVTTDNPYTISVTNKTLSAIRIKMFMPRGVRIENNGDKNGVRVEYEVQQAVDGGSFETVLTDVIEGKTMSGYDRSRRVNLPNFNNQVIFRVVRKTPDSNDSNVVDAIQVKSYAEVIDAKFRYPLTGLLFVEFDSKMFPNQLPTISIRKRWKIVNVPSNYDPESRTYNGNWDGTFKKAWTNNPAWVLYDLMINQRYGLDQKELGISVDKWALYEAAQYCDQMVPDGKGGTEPRYLCDVIIQSQTDAYKVIRDICSIFRGMSFWNGESISVIIDRPREPAYIFTNDNVVNGDFSYTFASEKSMYTTCNVMFDDEQNMYQQDVEPVFDREATLRFGNNVTSITAIGCTRRSEANRRGRWILKTNLRSTTVNFATGLEGMIPTIGDVVAIADNFWSSNLTMNLSGRLLEVSGSQIFLPFRVDARAGDFIIVNKPDGKPVKRTISSVSADGKTIEVNIGFGFPVKPNAVFAIDRTDIALQQYVVTKIDKGDDDEEFTYKITAVEYDPNKYDEIDYGVNIDDRPTSIVEPDQIPRPENVQVSSESRIVQGMSVETMIVSWDKVPYAVFYDVQWRKDNGNWQNVPQTANKEVYVEGIYAGNYQVRVRSVAGSGTTSGWSNIVAATLTGKQGEPGRPINLTATDDVVFGIRTKWGFSDGSGDTAYTELQQSPDGTVDNASLLSLIPYPQHEYYHSPMPGGNIVWYRVRTVDRIGNVSQWTDFVRGMASTNVDDIIGEISVDIENSPGYKWLVDNATDNAAQNAANAEAAIENALANDKDAIYMKKENGKRKAEYTKSLKLIADETQARVTAIEQLKASFGDQISASNSELREVIATETEALSREIDQLKAQIGDDIQASLTDIREAIANEAEARTQADLSLSARLGDNEAALSQKLDSWSNADSTGAMYGVKLGLKYNGQEYSAGMAMSLIGSGAAVKAQILFEASRFAIMTGMNGQTQYPFVVEGNQVILNSAIIKNGFITNAMIGNFIQSNNYVFNQSGWRLDKGGTFENYGSDGEGAMKQTNTTISVRDASGRLRVQIGRLTGSW
ncbi:tail fiber protein [Shigella phage Sfin-3]|uniref:Tail fiber protein n=1 Tax=Shigella phage Sfin-3 TaxID=2848075 RepID=A0A5Q2EZG9_9CAUD|nr:tail protein [Shigella phage Sfin-3]QGF19732.1 tail fiber protein [Shigella phage Sfin-3]